MCARVCLEMMLQIAIYGTPELALLVGKKESEFSSDVLRRQTRRREGFLKADSKINRKLSLLTVWLKMGMEGEAASGTRSQLKGEQTSRVAQRKA